MNKYPERPTLSETESEYLLKIHPAAKERAKGIEGRRWDMERQCWVYPKIQRVYNALIGEFGDELLVIKRGMPSQSPSSKSPEIGVSKPGIGKTQVDTSQDEPAKLRSELASKEAELRVFEQRLSEREAENTKISRELKSLRLEVETLKLDLRSRKSKQSLDEVFREVAVDATSNDPKFRQLVERLTFDQLAPVKIVIKLTEELRQCLDKRGLNSTGDLYDLINTAKEHELLPQGAVDLAHTIRRQRNVVAHESLHEKTILPRVLVSLFSAALLWPELPE